MKHLFSFLRIDLENSFDTLKSRFPLQTIIIITLTGILLYALNTENDDPMIIRMIFTSIVTFFLSVGIRLFREEKDKNHFSLSDIIAIGYGIIFYITVDPTSDWWMESFVFFLLHLTGFISFTFFAPYLLELFHVKVEKIEYTNYFTRVAWTFLMSGIVGLSLLLLGFIAIASVTALFDLSTYINESKFYGNWAIISLALSAPLYGLSTLPKKWDINTKVFEVNTFFSFLVRFVATPFIYIYFFILYAYSIKVLANFDNWPKGMISWMVIGFSTFGYIAYIFSLAYEDMSRIVRIFRKYFPFVVIPQIGMLSYAIGIRIAQYDLTMNRYFVVVFGLWLLGISLYFILSKKKSLVSIMASLGALSLLISVGPWSVYSLPLSRQYERLTDNLTKAELMQDGIITKSVSGSTIEKILQNDIYSGLEYVCGFDECSKLKELFPKEYTKAYDEGKKNWDSYTYEGKKEYTWPSKYEIVQSIANSLGISYQYSLDTDNVMKYIQLTSLKWYDDTDIFPLSVEWYTLVTRIYGANEGRSGSLLSLNPDSKELTFSYEGNIKRYSLETYLSNLIDQYGTKERYDIPKESLITTVKDDAYEIQIIFQSLSILNPSWKWQWGENSYYGISGYALIKKVQ